mmetsp:Transcript_52005/g.100471  ORF Transcript_52005/g.100471 Transcript_52005/m.100471 type:complete len:264 (-) Transcript_52005:369-1160(-)
MPLTTSHGIFTSSRAYRSASATDISRLYFRTEKQAASEQRPPRDEDRGENMKDIWNVGQGTSKYMQRPVNQAPAHGRESSSYSREYFGKPLGYHECNKALADMHRDANLGGDRGRTSNKVKAAWLGRTTSSAGAFIGYSAGEIEAARPTLQGNSMARTDTLRGASSSSAVKISHAQQQHGKKDGIPASRAPQHPNNLSMGVALDDSYKSQYAREFTDASSNVAAAPHFALQPDGHAIPCHQLPNETTTDIFQASRAVCFGPGI